MGSLLWALAALALTACGPSDFNIDAERWGFIAPDGQWAVEARFQDARSFHEGLAAVKHDGQWGYIDPNGQWVVEPQFEFAGDFHEGLARVNRGMGYEGFTHLDGQWGYLDRRGDWAIEPTFALAFDFSDGRAAATHDPPASQENAHGAERRFGYIDPSGQWAVEPAFASKFPFRDGVAPVRLHGVDPPEWGWLRRDGSWLRAPEPDVWLSAFHEGVGLALSHDEMAATSRYDVVNTSGALTATLALDAFPQARDLSGFREGLVRFNTSDDKDEPAFGFADRSGQVAIDPEWAWAGHFHEGLASARAEGEELCGYLNPQGEWAIAPAFQYASDFSEGRAVVGEGVRILTFSRPHVLVGRFGFIDRSGRPIVELRFNAAQPFREGLAAVRVLREK